MRSHLAFRCDRLRDEERPGGEKLARLLAERLPDRGFVVQRVDPEDWGWVVRIVPAAFPLWIGCGWYEEHANGHLCFIEPAKPHVRRRWRHIPTTGQVERLATALEQVVRSEPDTYDIRWWADADTPRG